MRSYYDHLDTTVQKQEQTVAQRPIFRSSAIFPVVNNTQIHSRILFMGYWLLKRKIDHISCVITLRSETGATLYRHIVQINEPRSRRVELKEILQELNIQDFMGSLEVEFYSNTNMVFPFPAVVVNYYGPHFSTVVHTAQRVFNDYEDLRNNSQTSVPESGFNLYADDNREPFIGLINGPESVPNATVTMEFFNSKKESLSHTLQLGTLAPYQTLFIYPNREVDLKKHFQGQVGTCRLKFDVRWIFPRLIVGNKIKNPEALTITHTYYDCTAAKSESDYWKFEDPSAYNASLMIPVTLDHQHFTNVYFYPIYSPSSFDLDVEFYDRSGNLLGKKGDALHIDSPHDKFETLPLRDIALSIGITPNQDVAARIIGRRDKDQKFPSRIKLGLDLGEIQSNYPCNICTNLQPFNPTLDTKPFTFKWGPILADQPICKVWLMNSSSFVHYDKTAEVDLKIYRERDNTCINRKLTIPPFGFMVIDPAQDQELKEFLGGEIGWYTVVTNNPSLTTYYFSENPSGVVGGDHGF